MCAGLSQNAGSGGIKRQRRACLYPAAKREASLSFRSAGEVSPTAPKRTIFPHVGGGDPGGGFHAVQLGPCPCGTPPARGDSGTALRLTAPPAALPAATRGRRSPARSLVPGARRAGIPPGACRAGGRRGSGLVSSPLPFIPLLPLFFFFFGCRFDGTCLR